jgi:tetratricopeptide (TPR) repeat protein
LRLRLAGFETASLAIGRSDGILTGRQGRQPNANHRSVAVGNIVKKFTILHIRSTDLHDASLDRRSSTRDTNIDESGIMRRFVIVATLILAVGCGAPSEKARDKADDTTPSAEKKETPSLAAQDDGEGEQEIERLEFDSLPEDIREIFELLDLPGTDEALAITALGKIADEYPGFVPGRLNLAVMQLQSGDADAAEATYRGVLADFPNEWGAMGGLATVHAARKEFDAAEKLARQAVDNGYDWPPLYEVIGEARENAGDVQAASAAYLASYRRSPHSWNCLERYCRLQGRAFTPPTETVANPLDDETFEALLEYIDTTAHTPNEDGETPGCDHTFRFTEQWAEKNGVDIIELYQFLNAHGGFCDCEVCLNVAEEIFGEEDE